MKKYNVYAILTLCLTLSCSGGGGMGNLDFGNDTTPTPQAPPTLGETYISVWPISDSEIQISLSAKKGSYEIAYYELYRDSVLIGPITGDSWTDGQLGYGSTYCYTAVAIDSGGNRSPTWGLGCATTGWRSEAVDSSPGPAQLQTHQDDSPRLAYVADEGVRTAVKRNSVWEIETASNIESFFDDFADNVLYAGPYITALRFAISTNDASCIFYNLLEDVHDYKYSLWKTSQDGSIWNVSRICFDCTADDSFDAVSDSADNAHLSFYWSQFGNPQSMGLAYASETAPDVWDFQTIGSNDEGRESSITVDNSGKASIVYNDLSTKTINYVNNQQGVWVKTIIAGPFTKEPYFSISSALDSNEKLHVVYYDPDTDSLVYLSNASGVWVTDTIEQGTGGGKLNAIAVGPANSLHVAYSNSNENGILYATNAGGQWSHQQIENTGGIASPSIALDSNGKVHIAYIGKSSVNAPPGLFIPIIDSKIRYVVPVP
jgi:hypothetical protein